MDEVWGRLRCPGALHDEWWDLHDQDVLVLAPSLYTVDLSHEAQECGGTLSREQLAPYPSFQ